MKYEKIVTGNFIDRPNRFIANVMIDGEPVVCHVKNTGRCKELLTPNAQVFLEVAKNPERKTKYDLIGVKKGDIMINMDSQAPNIAVGEWLRAGNLFPGATVIKSEKTYGKSRFDFYIEVPFERDLDRVMPEKSSDGAMSEKSSDGMMLKEKSFGSEKRRIFLEVKGVTLEDDGVARFPDAPTERGIKHIEELVSSMQDGYEAYIIFVIQMKGIKYFEPNDVTHKAFGDALRKASQAGVHVLAYDCIVAGDEMVVDKPIPVKF